MINTHLKFEAKILNGSKVVAFTNNYTKIFQFQGQFNLEGQGQGHQFSNLSEIFRRSINSLNVTAKFHMGQYKSLKQILSNNKFLGQFDLEGQGQDSLSVMAKFHMGQ